MGGGGPRSMCYPVCAYKINLAVNRKELSM